MADVDPNRVAAAGVRLPGEESEGLAVFVLHRGELEGFVAKAQGIRRAIAEQTGVEVGAVVPVSQIPKTTSGKLQRYLLARAFEQGEFAAVLARLAPLLAPAGRAAGEPVRSRARRWVGCRRSANVLYRTDRSGPRTTCWKQPEFAHAGPSARGDRP